MVYSVAMKSPLLIAILLTGCAATGDRNVWVKSDMAYWDKDARECNYEAKKVFNENVRSPLMARHLGEQTYDACLMARGYTAR